MLSSVLNSERAVKVNIEIMRAFVKLRQMLASDAELARLPKKLLEQEGYLKAERSNNFLTIHSRA